ncbi:MAG: PHP domain-containing protein [Bacteroidota bacterium]
MDNKSIIDTFRLMAKLMELHEENPFKIRGYQNVVFNLEKLETPLRDMSAAELEAVAGKTFGPRIAGMVAGTTLPELAKLLETTPEGVVRMMEVKGLGPKKIRTLWKDNDITSPEQLLQACNDNVIAKLKGFGEKTQDSIRESLEFNNANAGKLLYSDAEELGKLILEELRNQPETLIIEVSGELRLKSEIVDNLSFFVSSNDALSVHKVLDASALFMKDVSSSGPFAWRGTVKPSGIPVEFLVSPQNRFVSDVFMFSARPGHLLHQAEGISLLQAARAETFTNEEDIYARAGLPFIVPEMREGLHEFEWIKKHHNPELLTTADLRGVLHNHCTYSDGSHTLEQMALHARELGYEYLGISDHSRTATYAGGLDIERVEQQQREIDSLNKQMAPFKIFKGIESDILNDGSLDYPDEILATFDFIVASVHSVLNMDEERATRRLITAIENPYTTFLGHPTGRLLLKRGGYPNDHKAIIDACAQNNVIIEINANPWRLDIDWRWVHYAMEKGVMLSINPDAHEKAGYADMYYGVCAGRKGGLTKAFTFNTKSLAEAEAWFSNKKSAVPV